MRAIKLVFYIVVGIAISLIVPIVVSMLSALLMFIWGITPTGSVLVGLVMLGGGYMGFAQYRKDRSKGYV